MSRTPWRLPFRFRRPDRFLAVGAALVLVIAAGDALIIAMQRASEVAAYETAGANLSRGMSAQTSHLLEVAGKLLQDVERDLEIGEIASPERIAAALGDRGAVALATESAKQGLQARPVALVDASGKVVASRVAELAIGSDASGQDLFRRLGATNGPDLAVGAPRQDSAGAWNFYVARRLNAAGRAFAGVALLQMPVREFEDFYRLAMPPRREITVMTSDGTILVHYPHRDGLVGKKAALPATLGPDAKKCAPFEGPDTFDSAPVVAVLCRVGAAPLILETSAAEDVVLGPWRQERLWLAFGGVLIALGVVWLLYVFARQMRRLQISELSLATRSEQLEAARSQLEIALANIAQGVSFLDAEHRLVVANDRYRELYGLAKDDIAPGTTLSEILRRSAASIGFHDVEIEDIVASIEEGARKRLAQNSMIRFKNGRMLSVRRQPLPDGGWVATHEDITDRRRAEEKISFLANHDPLTGLVNRSVLVERIMQLLEAPSERGFAVLFLDLDRFKSVNDTLGHDVGDELLRQVAARMTTTVRSRDIVARFGGDEFVVLQADVRTRDDVASLARRLIEATSAPYKIGPHEITIGASAGIEITEGDVPSANTLIKHADIALYTSKARGRGTFSFFEPQMDHTLQ